MKVFLSPAQHHKKCLVDGCSEAIHCNKIVDAMEPYLKACGIEYLRNDKTTEKPMDHVRKANAWGADLYLALHTNAGGGKRCTFYNSGSVASQEYSLIFAEHFREVYPNLVKPNDSYPPEVCEETWTELTRSNAPAVYAEQWFHDNETDCKWGHDHIDETARSHVKAICEIFGVNFVEKQENLSKPVEKPVEKPAPKPAENPPYVLRNLKKGDTGDDVEGLQIQLMQLGYDLMEYGADGVFGGETLDAVKDFQRDAGIDDDGIVGPVTRAALLEAYDITQTYTVKKGDTLVAIARAHGTTAAKLAKINDIENPSLIVPGMVLRLEE